MPECLARSPQAYDENVTKLVGLVVTVLVFALPVSAEATKAGQQLADGSFCDYIGKTAPGVPNVVIYQTFTATMMNSAGYAPGVARAVMVHYPGYRPEYFGNHGALDHERWRSFNDYFYHPSRGRQICDNTTFP